MSSEPTHLHTEASDAVETPLHPEVSDTVKPPPKFPAAPYRGIDHFRFVDHPIFFARKRETLELLRCVMVFKGMMLFGGSGSGKSSLINAGLLTQIIEMGFVPDRVRVQDKLEQEIVIERISLFDDENPPFLAPSLAEGLSSNGNSRVVFSLKQFEEKLRAHAEEVRPLIILDQFEEMITLFEETEQSQSALKESLIRQKQILDLLVRFLHDESLPIKILFAFREDYLAKFTKLFRWAPELPNQYLRLTPPQTTALKDIIALPLSKDLLPHYVRQQTFSDDLINRLIEEFTSRSEGGTIDLSQVQIVCRELWQAEDPARLLESRKIAGLLEDYFKKELKALSPEQQHLATGLLSHMLTYTNTRNFISGVELIRLFQSEETASEEALKDVLKALTNTQLVRRELRHGSYYYEIASEFLVPWIIKRKIERQADFARRKIAAETQREREEERKKARQRLIVTQLVLALAMIITAFVIVLALFTNSRRRQEMSLRVKAEAAEKEAQSKRDEKEKIINTLTRLFTVPAVPEPMKEPALKQIRDTLQTDKRAAIRQLSFLIEAGQISSEQVNALIPLSLTRHSDPEVAKAAQDVLAQAAEAKARQKAIKEQSDKAKLDAIQDMRTLMKEKSFPPELVLSLLGPSVAKEPNPAISKAAGELLKDALAANREDLGESIAEAGKMDPTLANILPERVYIQIESQQQSARAKSIKAELEKNGYIVPDFEVVTSVRAPRRYELRYYRQADEEKSKEIVAVLNQLQLDVKPVYLKGQENNKKIRPGHFELWMATQSKPGEDFYLIINYSAGTQERQDEILFLINQITGQAGGDVEPISAHEVKVGPYDQEQARRVRALLIEQDSRLQRRILIRRP